MMNKGGGDVRSYVGMKIGIISNYEWLQQWDNYGTLFQNFALQKVLQNYGHDTFWILTKGGDPGFSGDKLKSLLIKLRHSPDELVHQTFSAFGDKSAGREEALQVAEFNKRHPRNFYDFLAKYVAHTPSTYSHADLKNDPPCADAYIVGSDNIWAAVTTATFLDFGPPKTRRIAYAVSAPWTRLSRYWYAKAARSINKISHLSVREADGISVCNKLARKDVVQVLDPTLLLDSDDYRKLISSEAASEKFPRTTVLGYFLNTRSLSELPWEAMTGFSAAMGADFKAIPLQGAELVIPEEFVYAPAPAAWLNAYDNADYILTNSFHGTVFAIIMKKQFLVIPHGKWGHVGSGVRFSSILKLLGLEDRLFTGNSGEDIKAQIHKPIDWNLVDAKLQVERKRSMDFIGTALSADRS